MTNQTMQKVFCLLVALFVSLGGVAMAQVTWDGDTDNNLTVGTNWDDDLVPVATGNYIVDNNTNFGGADAYQLVLGGNTEFLTMDISAGGTGANAGYLEITPYATGFGRFRCAANGVLSFSGTALTSEVLVQSTASNAISFANMGPHATIRNNTSAVLKFAETESVTFFGWNNALRRLHFDGSGDIVLGPYTIWPTNTAGTVRRLNFAMTDVTFGGTLTIQDGQTVSLGVTLRNGNGTIKVEGTDTLAGVPEIGCDTADAGTRAIDLSGYVHVTNPIRLSDFTSADATNLLVVDGNTSVSLSDLRLGVGAPGYDIQGWVQGSSILVFKDLGGSFYAGTVAEGALFDGLTINGGPAYMTEVSTGVWAVYQEQVPPTVSISLPDLNPTVADELDFTVVFSEEITTFTTSDIHVDTDLASGADVTSITTTDMTTFTVTVTTVDGTENGNLGITVLAGVEDFSGNALVANEASAQYEINNDIPIVTISTPSPAITNTGPVDYTVSYANVTDSSLANTDITLDSPDTADAGSVSVTDNGGHNYTVTLSSITGDGTLGITVAAATGTGPAGSNVATPSDTDIVVDNTGPQITVTPAVTGIREGGTVVYNVTYDDDSGTINLTESDITLTTSGVTIASVIVTDGATSTPVVTVVTSGGTGEITDLTIAAGTSTDALGNADTGASASAAVTVIGNVSTLFLETFESATLDEVWYDANVDGDVTDNTKDSGENVWTFADGDGVGSYTITNTWTSPNQAFENTGTDTVNNALAISAPLSAPVTMEAGRQVTILVSQGFVTTSTAIDGWNQNRYWVTDATGDLGLCLWAANGLATGAVENVYLPRASDGSAGNNMNGLLDAGDCRAAEGVLDDIKLVYTPEGATTSVEMEVYREGSLYASGRFVLDKDMRGVTLTQVEFNLKPETTFVIDRFEVIEGPVPTAVSPDAWLLY